MTKIYEMFWDCAFCDTKKLLGKSQRFCPCCGAPQDADKRYFPPEDEKIAVEDHKYVGVDRTCSACSATISAACGFCTGCGASMDGSKSVKLVQGTQTTGSRQPAPPKPAASSDVPVGEKPVNKSSGNIGGRVIISLVVLVIVGGVGLFAADWALATKTEVEVTSMPWTREISVEQYNALEKSDWCKSIPSEAYSIKRSQRDRTEKVVDGETCSDVNVDNGDGTFRKEQKCSPRYVEKTIREDYCHYAVNRWQHFDTFRKEGDLARGEKPTWPEVNIRESSQLVIGAQRIDKRTADYAVEVRDPEHKDDIEKCSVQENFWTRLTTDVSLSAKRGGVFGGIQCGSLE